MPTAPEMLGVPASNLNGSSLNVVFSKLTVRIMSPPPCHGGMASSSDSRPIQHADAGGAVHLVRREGVEVAVERLQVHALVRHGLRAIESTTRAARVRERR